MTLEEIIKITNKVLVEEFEVEESVIQSDASMKDSLDLDSLDYVDLIVFIEENFDVKLEPEEFSSIKTFDDFYNLIFKKINE